MILKLKTEMKSSSNCNYKNRKTKTLAIRVVAIGINRLRQFFLPFSLVQKHECRNKSYILSLPKQKAKGSGLMQNNTLMLWKDDFKSDKDWQAVCRALGLPESTVEVELRCNVRVAKSNYTHTRLHKPV